MGNQTVGTRVRSPRYSAGLPLPDGAWLDVHPLGPADARALRSLLDDLSPEDRRLRFFRSVPMVTDALVAPLCDVDHTHHVAWLLSDPSGPVAEVRAVRAEHDATSAEVAFAVHPAWRGRGVATTAVRALGAALARHGVTELTAEVLPENRASVALLRRLGLRVTFVSGGLVARGPVPTSAAPPRVADRLAALILRPERAAAA